MSKVSQLVARTQLNVSHLSPSATGAVLRNYNNRESHADYLVLREKCDLMAMRNPIHITLKEASHRTTLCKPYDRISIRVRFVWRVEKKKY